MKKITSFALAIMMVAIMSVTAFAAEVNTDNGTASIPVKGTFQSATGAGEKVSVDISWGEMEFTYSAGTEEWDTVMHAVTTKDAGWSENGNTITIKNHSNVGVTAKFAFAASDNLTLAYEFKNGSETVADTGVNIESANNAKYQTPDEDGVYPAPTATVNFYITDGAISKNYNTEGTPLGNITVTISKQSTT